MSSATIRVIGTGDSAPTTPARSILVCLQQAGVPILTQCGGRAMCGKCAVRVHAGREYLSAPRERELDRLKAIAAPADARLACQTHTRGDLEIEILNPGRVSPGAP